MLVALQLALDNALAPYFTSQFRWSITKAGNLAAIFGLMNFVSRPLGGVFSDFCAKYFGMRGRLWALFFTLGVGGMATSIMGTQNNNSNVTLGMMVLAGWFLEVCTPVWLMGISSSCRCMCDGDVCVCVLGA